MIEFLRIAVIASVFAFIGPLGVGWLWAAVLTHKGESKPSLGMIYWLGLMCVGALIVLGHGLALSQTLVVVLVASASTGGWILHLMRSRRQTRAALTMGLPLLPLALTGIAYCVLDPVRVWDSYLIWLARVRLLEQWTSLSRFRDLRIVYPEYPYLGAAAWWWTEWTARVPVESGRIIFLFAYLAFFLAVLARYERTQSIRVRLLWGFFAYACFSLEIINGYQDGFLMVSAGMVALAFLQWGDRGAVWVMPLAAGLSLIKTEGSVLALILVFCWFGSKFSRLPAVQGNRLDRHVLLVGGLGFVLVLAIWPWLQLRNGLDPGNLQSGAFRIRSIGTAVSQADRLPIILRAIGLYYAQRPWISLPFLAAVGASLVPGEILDRHRRFLLGFVGLHLLFVITVFWLTQEPFEWHLGAALHRLLLQGRLVMLVFVFETANLRWARSEEVPIVRPPVASLQKSAGLVHIGRALTKLIANILLRERRRSNPAAAHIAQRTFPWT
jgi:hypothetical protein